MKRRYRTIKLLFGLGALLLAVLCCLPLINIGLGNTSSSIPITSLQDIQTETGLGDTGYDLEYTNQNLMLEYFMPKATQVILEHYSPVALPPAYQLLSYSAHTYLIIRLASGGNSGARWYKLFDLNSWPPVDLMRNAVAPLNGISCTYPRLDGNAFEFQISPNCADSAAAWQIYRVPVV